MKVSVLGAGSFGTALAQVFAQKASKVTLWTRDSLVAEQINKHHQHPQRFADIKLAKNIEGQVELTDVLVGAQIVVSALPMKALRLVMPMCKDLIEPDAIIVSTTKGIEPDTMLFPSQILQQALPNVANERFTVLSGPNFASEIIRGLPWAAVAASSSQTAAKTIQVFLSSPTLRVYFASDIVGVELGGAIKNVFAIAAGILDGFELGCNARAAMMTRALNEMSRFADALGGEQKTIYGLAGLGDMLLSCTSPLSRNWRLGQGLALGGSLEEIQADMGEVVEGVGTTLAAKELSSRFKLDAPLCDAVHSVLFEKLPPKEAISDLMSRRLGGE